MARTINILFDVFTTLKEEEEYGAIDAVLRTLDPKHLSLKENVAVLMLTFSVRKLLKDRKDFYNKVEKEMQKQDIEDAQEILKGLDYPGW